MKNRQECEVFSRIVGYIRPVNQWNKGKQAEYFDRKTLNFNHEKNIIDIYKKIK